MSVRRFVSKSVFTKCNRQQCEPNVAVLLLGWAGANDNQLSKYSEIYENMRISTLRYTASLPATTFMNPIVSPRYIRPLIDDFEKYLDCAPRHVVHLFSMNAVFLLSSLVSLRGSSVMRHFDGIIFDSCPALLCHKSCSYGLDALLPRVLKSNNPAILSFGRSLALCAYDINAAKNNLVALLTGKPEKQNIYQWLSRTITLPKAQLYIYSKHDLVCPHESIRWFHEKQQSERSAHVEFLCFEDSEHVDHYRQHPYLYSSAVRSLLNFVISR
ncbi:hypothetical protein AB6A40_002275 [Gnathostoma spinigerum]|uniref:Transmembrane protein 53 n=1 Tax=Gnathostoma spinigerum TaxID=75299 RepID=A0ABD6EDV2_9BILA